MWAIFQPWLQNHNNFYSYKFLSAKGDTTFSTLVHQFHKSLVTHYAKGGKNLYDPDEMEKFCDVNAPGLFEDIFQAILNDDKQPPSIKRSNLQWIRVVSLLHNLSFFRNQVWSPFPTNKKDVKTTDMHHNRIKPHWRIREKMPTYTCMYTTLFFSFFLPREIIFKKRKIRNLSLVITE